MTHLDSYVTLLPSIFDTLTFEVMPLREALERLADEWRDEVERVRSLTGDAQKTAKEQLPAFAFSGAFKRSVVNDDLDVHSGVVIIDYDNVGDPWKFIEYTVEPNPHALAAWPSARGEGVKVLIALDKRPRSNAEHRVAFAQVCRHLGVTAQEKSQHDVRRLCFVSAPDRIWINEAVVPFEVDLGEEAKPQRAEPVGDMIPHGTQHNTLVSLAGSMRRRGMNGDEIFPALWEVNKRCEKPGTEKAIRRIADSMMQYEPAATSEDFAYTDLGLAERYVATFADEVRYCHPWKAWLVWDGRRWQRDETGAARRLMYSLVRTMQRQGAEIEDESRRTAFLKHALDYQKRAKMEAALAIAENLPGVPVMPSELDASPWLLTVENGTIDLRLGKLQPHDPADRITKLAPVHYDEGATAERFERFILEIFDGSEPLAKYMRRLSGYAMTGSVREQIIAVMHGMGSNGKGTLLETLQAILGDYAQSIRPDLLMMKRHAGGASEGEAALHGARFVTTSETGNAQRLDESLVKRLTGGDTIRARFLHANEFEFRPTHQIFLATNHKPVIYGTDHAIWRRIHLVPFDVRFEGERADPELPEKLRYEAPGILNWLIDGCLEWQRDGLQPPDEVTSATSSYRAEMDVLAGFIEDRCTIADALSTSASDLYREYRKWADANGEQVLTQTRFGLQMSERGFEKEKSGTVYYRGIALAAHTFAPSHEPETVQLSGNCPF